MATFEYQCFRNVNKRMLSFLLSMYGAYLKICKSIIVNAIESFENFSKMHFVTYYFADVIEFCTAIRTDSLTFLDGFRL